MSEPVITACMCTGEPRSILDEAGMHVLVEGFVVCPHCGRNPFGFRAASTCHTPFVSPKSMYETMNLPDSEGGDQ